MPTYDYRHLDDSVDCSLSQCFERFEPMSATPLATCETCGKPVVRLIGPGGGILFRGSGFYCTDYPKEKK